MRCVLSSIFNNQIEVVKMDPYFGGPCCIRFPLMNYVQEAPLNEKPRPRLDIIVNSELLAALSATELENNG